MNGPKNKEAGEKWLPHRFAPVGKALLLLLALLFAVALIHLTPVRQWLKDVHSITAQLKSFGGLAPLVFVVVVSALIAVGVPRLLLCSIGGLAFGFLWGLIWTQLGTMIGYYITFLFVRWSGRDYVLKKWPKLTRYKNFFSARGLLIVLLIRQLPIAGFYINIVLGLTHIRHINFLLGTVVGILPEAIPATMIGAGIIHLSPEKSIAAITAAVILFMTVWSLVARYLRTHQMKIQAAVDEPVETEKENISD